MSNNGKNTPAVTREEGRMSGPHLDKNDAENSNVIGQDLKDNNYSDAPEHQIEDGIDF